MPLAQLQEIAKKYDGQVAKLLSLGREAFHNKRFSYKKTFGFDEDDIAQLFMLASDMEIYQYDYRNIAEDEGLEFFGVIHAWKALSELGVPEAKAFFIERFEAYDFDAPDEWIIGEFRSLIAPYRHSMYDDIVKYVEDESHCAWVRMEYLEVIKDMLEAKEVELSKVNPFLARLLKSSDDPIVNAGAISLCMDLKLTEHHELIAKCFERKAVDIDHIGDLEDVEMEMGLRTERETQRELTEMQKKFQLLGQNMRGFLEEQDDQTILPFINSEEKVGRNDPCPCGSGKKYKKCCLNE